jgi:hypothetical protein
MRVRWIALFLFCGLVAAWWRGNSFEAELTLATCALLWGLRCLSGEVRAMRDRIEREEIKFKIRGIDDYVLHPTWKRPKRSQEATSDIFSGDAAARSQTRSA